MKNQRNIFGKSSKLVFFRKIKLPKQISTIRANLMISFIVPIIFIIILGTVSFQKAASAIRKDFEESTAQILNMTAEYLNFGTETVSDIAIELINDEDVKNYFVNMYDKSSSEYSSAIGSIEKTLIAKTTTNDFIQSVFMISDTVKTLSSVQSNEEAIAKDVYARFLETDTGIYLKENRLKALWIGKNDYLDTELYTTSSDHALRLLRNIQGTDAVLVIDISAKTVEDILVNTNFDESGFLAFVTNDGKEITAEGMVKDGENEVLFSDESFYQEALSAEADTGSKYVEYTGEDYLFMYSKIDETGAMLCALMPKATITKQADDIRQVTVVIIILACIVAVFIGFRISNRIDKTIKGIIKNLKVAAGGDLTVEFHSKHKDEFAVLIHEIQLTFTNMKDLIQRVSLLNGEVSESAIVVNKTSSSILKSTEDISTAMTEIEQGITQQAKDAEECLLQMDNLSKKIELVSDNTREINQIAENTKASITEGTICTEELNQQTRSTIEITTDIIRQIENLQQKSMSITKITNVIHELANQTNLLSLNASIEAARAGEYGKGFAVVADEIRKLAEESKASVNNIQKIISSIQEDTKKAVVVAKEAGNVLVLQESAVNNTTGSYQNINENVEKLMMFLKGIAENVNNIEETRVSTLASIENISAVLEEIAASTNTVNSTSGDQLASVEALSKSAGTLNENANELTEAVNRFTV